MLDGLTRMENSNKNELVKEKQLPNGMQLSFFNESKIMTGDRWLVKLHCQALLPLTEEDFASLPQDDPDLLQYLRKEFAGNLSFSTVRERVFVDDTEQEQVFAELLEIFNGDILNYLASPTFPRKLMADEFTRLSQEYRVKKELDMLVDDEEDDDGPADFSACFAD